MKEESDSFENLKESNLSEQWYFMKIKFRYE